ncbi:hypothetical protein BG030_20890 [Pseudomonas putida]|nr:hypothetical protein BG030_20890 [Pseudomonas putida]
MRGEAAERRRRALLTGELDRAIQVLEQRAYMPLDRLEAALGHLRRQDLQRLGIGKATGQRFGNQCRVYARLLGQCHYFGNHQGIAGYDHLVAGLGHLARAYRPHVRHALAKHLQHRVCTLQVGHLTTDHDGQCACFSTWRTARYRRIQPRHATQCCQFGCHFTGGGWFQA